MENVSFKARVEGLPSNLDVVTTAFAMKTRNDTKHTLVKKQGQDDMGRDVFELKKDGRKTAEYATEFNTTDESEALTKLTKIFGMLKIYEAQAFIRDSKIEKQRRIKEEQYHSEPE